jgi:hypothetical protein
MPAPIEGASVEVSLVQAIGSSQLPELTIDIAEAALDQFLVDGLLKDVPVLGSIVRAARLSIDINNYLFLRKLARFLLRLGEVPEATRKSFVGELHGDPGRRREVGERLMLILNRLDDISKADLLGRLFKAYVMGRLSYELFSRASTALDRASVYSLRSLERYYAASSTPLSEEELQDLSNAGLVTVYFGTGALNDGGGGYKKNDLGAAFVAFALQD